MEIQSLIIGIGTPVVAIVGGIIAWAIKSRSEDLRATENRALERRIETYDQIMHPMVIIFNAKGDKTSETKATKIMLSVDYRKAALRLVTFGSDQMVDAYNELMQHFYTADNQGQDTNRTMELFAHFLLAIRKDVFDKKTKLEKWDMLKHMITDIDTITKTR